MIGPDQYWVLGPLQPMLPLGQGGMDGQELPIPHVVVGLSWGEVTGQEGYWVDVLVLL